MGEYTVVGIESDIQRYQRTTLSPDELVDAWAFDPSDDHTWMEATMPGM